MRPAYQSVLPHEYRTFILEMFNYVPTLLTGFAMSIRNADPSPASKTRRCQTGDMKDVFH